MATKTKIKFDRIDGTMQAETGADFFIKKITVTDPAMVESTTVLHGVTTSK